MGQKPRWRLGLLARIALALGAAALLPLALLVFRLYDVNADTLREQVQRTHAVAARATGSRLESFVAGAQRLATALAENPQLQGSDATPAMQQLLASMLLAQDDARAIVVQGADGGAIVRAQRPGLGPVVDQVLARAKGSPWLGGVGGRRYLLVTAKRREQGTIRVLLDAETLAGLFRPEEIGPQADLFLVDPGGTALFARRPQARVPAALQRLAATGRVSGAQVVHDERGRATVVGALWPLEGAPWTVVTVQPAAIAEGLAADLRRQTLLAVLLALAIATALVVVAYRSLVRPVRDMLAAQEELGLVRRDDKGGGNEVERLRDSLAQLADRVRRQQDLGRVFLGRYEVLDVLGHGGMGTVFRGFDPRLQRMVALKTIQLQQMRGGEDRHNMVSTLLQEAVSAARFNHSNIVAVYDLEEAGGSAYVAMELVDGCTLERYVWQLGPLPPSQVVPLAAAVADGLAAAHGQGLVHRDIKPANVLLGRDDTVKLGDFGIAAVLGTLRDHHDFVFGTPGYLAPEAIRGEPYLPTSDLFALGCVIYYALTGEAPFTGTDLKHLMRATLFDEPPSLRHRVADLPPELDRLIASLLEKRQQLRPPTAREVAADLRALAVASGWLWHYLGPPPASASVARPAAPAQWIPTMKLGPPTGVQG